MPLAAALMVLFLGLALLTLAPAIFIARWVAKRIATLNSTDGDDE